VKSGALTTLAQKAARKMLMKLTLVHIITNNHFNHENEHKLQKDEYYWFLFLLFSLV